MSDERKGARKQKGGPTAGPQVQQELITSVLIAVLYALFLVETIWESGLTALIFSVILFAVLVLMAYLIGSGSLKGQRQFKSLVYAFVGLSALSMVIELLRFLNVPAMVGLYWAGVLGAVNAVVSVIAIAALLYVEKDDLKKLYLNLGELKVAGLGALGLALCIIAGFIGAYYVFGGNTISQGKFTQIAISVVVFAILSGIAEEIWFRGVLLSRIIPILGESKGNIFQAAVFGVFETVIFYMITGLISYLPVIFIIGAFTGFYWGRATLKANSLAAPALLHAGLYILLLLPLVTGISS